MANYTHAVIKHRALNEMSFEVTVLNIIVN